MNHITDPSGLTIKRGNVADVVVVGAGINGLVMAYELAKEGVSVTLLDRREVGREASWAGGGLLCPLGPWRYSTWVQEVALDAQRYYPSWLDDLRAHTSVDPEFVNSGMVMVNVAAEPGFERWQASQRAFVPVNRQAFSAFSFHDESFSDGWWAPEVNQVRNSKLISALVDALDHLGVNIVPWGMVHDVLRAGRRVVGVATTRGRLFADSVVVAAGAWSRGLLLNIGIDLPLEPVLGQMLRLVGPHRFTAVLMEERRYLIPRADGSVLLGATSEHTGFNKVCTSKARSDLLDWAGSWWSGLSKDWVSHHWCGLRPASPDSVPFVGRMLPFENLWVSTGHFRNGLLMAPLLANRLVADMMTNQGRWFVDLSPSSETCERLQPNMS